MKLATRSFQKTQGFIRFLHLRAISVQLCFPRLYLKKVEKPKILQCFSLDLVVWTVCCSHASGFKIKEKHKVLQGLLVLVGPALHGCGRLLGVALCGFERFCAVLCGFGLLWAALCGSVGLCWC